MTYKAVSKPRHKIKILFNLREDEKKITKKDSKKGVRNKECALAELFSELYQLSYSTFNKLTLQLIKNSLNTMILSAKSLICCPGIQSWQGLIDRGFELVTYNTVIFIIVDNWHLDSIFISHKIFNTNFHIWPVRTDEKLRFRNVKWHKQGHPTLPDISITHDCLH